MNCLDITAILLHSCHKLKSNCSSHKHCVSSHISVFLVVSWQIMKIKKVDSKCFICIWQLFTKILSIQLSGVSMQEQEAFIMLKITKLTCRRNGRNLPVAKSTIWSSLKKGKMAMKECPPFITSISEYKCVNVYMSIIKCTVDIICHILPCL